MQVPLKTNPPARPTTALSSPATFTGPKTLVTAVRPVGSTRCVAAYPAPPKATNSAATATIIDGDGRRRRFMVELFQQPRRQGEQQESSNLSYSSYPTLLRGVWDPTQPKRRAPF